MCWYAVAQRYNPNDADSIPDGVTGKFSLT